MRVLARINTSTAPRVLEVPTHIFLNRRFFLVLELPFLEWTRTFQIFGAGLLQNRQILPLITQGNIFKRRFGLGKRDI